MKIVVKADGRVEPFDREKLARSLIRAGASRSLAESVAARVEAEVPDGASTEEVLSAALRILEKVDPALAALYDLKRAVMRLGPTGFPFERYFAKILEAVGYRTRLNVVVRGRCVDQEVDVTAERRGVRFMVECKHHDERGVKTDLKVAMYTYARFLDVRGEYDRPWLATNTALTPTALRYARCVGMRVTSWLYPPGRWSLASLIERTGLLPVTTLRSLRDPTPLIREGLVTLLDLVEEGGRLADLLGERDSEVVLGEARSVLARLRRSRRRA